MALVISRFLALYKFITGYNRVQIHYVVQMYYRTYYVMPFTVGDVPTECRQSAWSLDASVYDVGDFVFLDVGDFAFFDASGSLSASYIDAGMSFGVGSCSSWRVSFLIHFLLLFGFGCVFTHEWEHSATMEVSLRIHCSSPWLLLVREQCSMLFVLPGGTALVQKGFILERSGFLPPSFGTATFIRARAAASMYSAMLVASCATVDNDLICARIHTPAFHQ